MNSQKEPGAFYRLYRRPRRDINGRRYEYCIQKEPGGSNNQEPLIREPLTDMLSHEVYNQEREKKTVVEIGEEKKAISRHDEQRGNVLPDNGD